jgi:cytochrome c6
MYRILTIAFFTLLVFACGGAQSERETASLNGEQIYKDKCAICHGIDGKLGLNGSKDLTVSTVTEAERIVQITKGKNTMTPFEGILTPEEIKAVAAYSMTLTAK